MTLLDRFRSGDRRALARLITLVENHDPAAETALAAVAVQPGRARVIGMTGPPGAGKSSLIAGLVAHWRAQGRSIAVLAIDPSSTRTGGAALGDRLRLAGLAGDPEIFIRSMASRGQLGGLAEAAGQAVRLLAGFGYEIILVETVGVGQAEIEIARLADVVVVVQVPGLGDEMQAIKAGILEIADIIAVNKSDRPGAGPLAAQLRALVAPVGATPPPVLLVSASHGTGLAELAEAIESATPVAPAEPTSLATAVVEATLRRLRRQLAASPRLAELAEQIAAGHLTVEEAATALSASFNNPSGPSH